MRKPHKPPARVPAEFITASQALDYLVGPRGPPLHPYAAGHRGETRREMAQACLIKAHTEQRIALVGRKGDMSNPAARSRAFERIPNEDLSRDVILGDSLVATPRRSGRANGEFWRDVKLRRKEFEAEFKFSSAEDALIRWWRAKTRHDGKPPTERDALVQFAQRQRPRLPRRWLCQQLKKFPKNWRRKGTGRPPGSGDKRKARSATGLKSSRDLKPSPKSLGAKSPSPSRSIARAPARPRRIAKDGPTKGLHPDYRHIIRQNKTEKTTPGWKVNLKRRNQYMHKYFRDTKYGGKERALKAAQAWLDSLMSIASDPDYMLWRMNKKPETNTSGVVGVGRYAVKYRRRKRLLWQAVWQDADGKRHCKRFFVSTHGERAAKALAVAVRREAMEELREELTRRGAIYD
ncbi:MAG TPA: AP2 domain-containing protein [Rhizomicrobium sp.]|nr:AP2 domain-containing protein [Rhizomicrobium sp.]